MRAIHLVLTSRIHREQKSARERKRGKERKRKGEGGREKGGQKDRECVCLCVK